MEWKNVKISQVEFERLLKEYTAAALRTAEKAKVLEDDEKISNEITKASCEDTTVLHQNEFMSINDITADNTDLKEKIEEDSEPEVFISAETLEENEPVAEPVEDEPNYETEEYSEQNEGNKQDNEQSSEQNENSCEQVCEGGYTEDGNTTDKKEPESVDDILNSFKSIFISEEEAERKAEEMSENKNISRSAPNFNSTIHTHNKSVKSCGCTRCRSNNSTTHIQEKGGHNTG